MTKLNLKPFSISMDKIRKLHGTNITSFNQIILLKLKRLAKILPAFSTAMQ
jgi:hypothetical protein